MQVPIEIENYAILNDIHFPFEDKARYKVALKILKSVLNLKHVYLNGDIGEFNGVSQHPKMPGGLPFCHEIDYINVKFDELGKMFPRIPFTLNEGNHCNRFFRYIRDVAPQMWGLITCPLILKFEQRPLWKFVPYGPSQLIQCGKSNLYLRHEPLGMGKNHAKATAENSNIDLAYGHTHQYQIATHRKFGLKPTTNKAYSLGWLGDETNHIFDYRGAKDNWVKGITIVSCEPKSGEYNLEFIDLSKLPVIYKGERFDAK